MDQRDCLELLAWALPRLELRQRGFRRVRRQVCRRIAARLAQLGLADARAYRRRLEEDPAEWSVLDGLCTVTISRFRRDRAVFECLEREVLPELAARAAGRTERELRAWSAGCASGEEPYSLVLSFELAPIRRPPGMALRILATDANEALLARARRARYHRSALRELPPAWIEKAFEPEGGELRLREGFRAPVELRRHDVRDEPPAGPFDLVFCRNLAFTYFDEPLQRRVLAHLERSLVPGGALAIGSHERLPPSESRFEPWRGCGAIYRRGGPS